MRKHSLVLATLAAFSLPLTTGIASATSIVPHPKGCPRTNFCGCGVSVKVFGKPIRNLFLARNWKKFPRAKPAPGMVVYWRKSHVAYIISVDGNGNALLYDPNSGGHKTRIWRRSIRGTIVVNPRAARYQSASN